MSWLGDGSRGPWVVIASRGDCYGGWRWSGCARWWVSTSIGHRNWNCRERRRRWSGCVRWVMRWSYLRWTRRCGGARGEWSSGGRGRRLREALAWRRLELEQVIWVRCGGLNMVAWVREMPEGRATMGLSVREDRGTGLGRRRGGIVVTWIEKRVFGCSNQAAVIGYPEEEREREGVFDLPCYESINLRFFTSSFTFFFLADFTVKPVDCHWLTVDGRLDWMNGHDCTWLSSTQVNTRISVVW